MSIKRSFAWALASFVFLITPARAVAGAPDLQSLLNQRVAGADGVGVVVGVIDHGKTALYQAGSSGAKKALDDHTLFEIGSVTKTFTATILATMVLDGSVRLNDPVAKYLPAFVHVPTRDGKQITLLNLATQHSGLPRLPTNLDASAPDPYAKYTLNDLYAFLNGYNLERDPGKSFEYSNLGIALLGDALAYRGRMSYARLLQTRVLGPLGMTETAMSLSASERLRFAAGHDGDNDPVNSSSFDAIAPAGALRSTVSDMLKYVRCNMGRGPLAQACLFAQKPRSTFPGNHIGLVWWTGDVKAIVHHGGDTAGYHASVAISADHLRGAVALTNGGAPIEYIAIHVVDPIFPVASASFPPVVQLDSATLEYYVGMYDAKTDGMTFSVRRVGRSVTIQLTGQPIVKMYSSAKDKFYLRVVEAQVDFTRAVDGSVSGLVLHQNGQDVSAVRTSSVAVTPTPAPSPSPTPASAALDAAALDEYAGTFNTSQGLAFSVTRSGQKLMVQLTGQPSVQVFASKKNTFYYRIVDAQIDFQRDATGKVTALVLRQNGQRSTATRAGVPTPVPSFPPTVALDAATLDGYVGTYIESPGAAFTVTKSGDQLLVQLTGQASYPVFATAKDEFYYKVVDARLSFERDANGKVMDVVLHQNGQEIKAVKTQP